MPDLPIITAVALNRPVKRLLPMVTELHDSGQLGPMVIDAGEAVQAQPGLPVFVEFCSHGMCFGTQNCSKTVCDGSAIRASSAK